MGSILALACAGALMCAHEPAQANQQTEAATLREPSEPQAVQPEASWWRSTGDMQLIALIDAGLTNDAEVSCSFYRLRQQDEADSSHLRKLGTRITRLFGEDDTPARADARKLRTDRIAARRLRIAQRIALAYVEVRRLQRREALRDDLLGQYRDNAEIAEFRRQAGLVPAIDGALARSQGDAVRAELDDDAARLADAMDTLAALINDKTQALAPRLGTTSAFPPWPPSPDAARPADTANRQQQLATALDAARRSVRDARAAYREGAGNMATLYVAESAVLTLELALVDAQARSLAEDIRRDTSGDNPWAFAGLDPAAVEAAASSAHDINVVAPCD